MRGLTRTVIAGLAIAAVGACSDSSTGPSEAARRELSPGDRPSLDYNGPSRFFGTRSATFYLTPAGGTYRIGDLFDLKVPANAVCAPGSSYGPGKWDDPCSTLSAGQSIRVTATYGFGRNGPVVDFSPDLRFSPRAQVTLSTDLYESLLTSFRGFFEANPSSLRYFGIYYTSDFGQSGTTDAAFDASLTTHINLWTGRVWRRVKHFSGYNVTSGLPCTPSPDDPDCVDAAPPPVLEREY
ncbi:MAG TPA: hypothetical protein VIP11_00180 [Gemmatimonadaceae bacterium]